MNRPQYLVEEDAAKAPKVLQQPVATPAPAPVFVQLSEDSSDANDNMNCALWIMFCAWCFPLSLFAIPCFITDRKQRKAAAKARHAAREEKINAAICAQRAAAPVIVPVPYAPAHLPPQRATDLDVDLEKGPTSA